ncbi:MAG: type II CAAX endopeptidase family protein [Myxococcota bacterium]|jgi:membrane protease YdiL (CAAX protease family)|nr:type II CAAX endopeptidase family protein [Myxococcota bacterium]
MTARRAWLALLTVSVVWGFGGWLLMSRWVLSSPLVGLLCAGLAWWLSGRGLPWEPNWRARGSEYLRATLAGVGAGVLLSALTSLLFPVVRAQLPAVGESVAALYSNLYLPVPLALHFGVVAVVGAAEELVWRGPLFKAAAAQQPILAVVAGSMLYGLAQSGFGQPILVLTAFSLGVCWALLRLWSGGLLAPILAHAIWQLSVLFVFPLS